LPQSTLEVALPPIYFARMLKKGIMSDDTKQAYDSLLSESLGLYRHFRTKGLSQVAIPYMGDLVVMLRTLPPELTLRQMVVRLREAARAGDRLLDENTAWWQWKRRSDSGPLVRSVLAARTLADTFERTTSDKLQQGPREKGSFAYDLFLQAATRIPIEAAGLYGIEETTRTATAEAKDEALKQSSKIKFDLTMAGILAGLGYVGYRWWSRPQTRLVVESFKPGYNPDYKQNEPEDSETYFEDDERIP
jgi:hypothetical protein